MNAPDKYDVVVLRSGIGGKLMARTMAQERMQTDKRFAPKGVFEFITGRRQDELDKAVQEIGKNVLAMKSDVSKVEDIDRLYKEDTQKKGKIDVFFANAGFANARIVDTVDTSAAAPEHFDKTFHINARGAYFSSLFRNRSHCSMMAIRSSRPFLLLGRRECRSTALPLLSRQTFAPTPEPGRQSLGSGEFGRVSSTPDRVRSRFLTVSSPPKMVLTR